LADGKPFRAARSLAKAQGIAMRLAGYRAELRVVSPADADALPDLASSRFEEIWSLTGQALDGQRVGVVVFAEAEGKRRTEGAPQEALAALLREAGFVTVQVAPPEGVSYEQLRRSAPADLRKWAGEQVSGLLAAKLNTRHAGSEKLGDVDIQFCEASGQAALLDLTDGGVMASAGFGFSRETRAANKERESANDAAIEKGSRLLGERLKDELLACTTAE
jgi:hypothetical protein